MLKGDFEEDPDTGQIIARMILTMIPGIDQLADVQDVVHVLYRLIWKQEWDEAMHWILLLITLIGLIPVLGSLAKGILKLVLKKIGDLSGLYAVFNYFKKGNAHRWIREFAVDLTGKHLDTALALLDSMMARVVGYMNDAKGWFSRAWNRRLDEALRKVGQFRAIAPRKLREAAADLQGRLLETLAKGMTRITRRGTRNDAPHTVTQRKQAPPERVFYRTQEEYDDLARDPSHGHQISPKSKREREVGLALEEAGEVPGPIKRDTSGDAEFIDANEQAWVW